MEPLAQAETRPQNIRAFIHGLWDHAAAHRGQGSGQGSGWASRPFSCSFSCSSGQGHRQRRATQPQTAHLWEGPRLRRGRPHQ